METVLRLLEEEQKLLLRNPLFTEISEADLAKTLWLLSAEVRVYRKGECFIQPGSRIAAFGLILTGTAHISTHDMDGYRMLVGAVTVGETFADAMCCLSDESAYWIEAASEMRVLWMQMDQLLIPQTKDIRAHHDMEAMICCQLRINFMRIFSNRLLRKNERVLVLSQPTLRKKLAMYFSQCARHAGSRRFQIPFDRNDMAAYLGVNRCALSRELSVMKREGVIDYYKNSFRITGELSAYDI